MLRSTPVFIVASPRPRVGKTLIARTLTEFFCVENRPVAAFDVNPDGFKLVDCLPAYTAAASIDDTRGEMALFDQLVLADGTAKVVDLGHTLFNRFFKVMQQIDFVIATERRGVTPMVLFVADPDPRARQGYAVLRDRFPRLPLVPVLNEAVPPVDRYRGNFPPIRRGGEPVQVPTLSPVVRSVIERPGFSFATYAAKSPDTTSELYAWMRRMFVAFRELEVRLLLREIAPQLRHSA